MVRTINTNQEFSCTMASDFDKDALLDILGVSKEPPKCKVEFSIGKIQRRKHKKRRINKKWAKKYGYKDIIVSGKLNQIVTNDNGESKFEISNIVQSIR